MDPARVQALRDEARSIADAPSVSRKKFEDWRKRTAATLQEFYGAESGPVREFAAIKFEDTNIVDLADRVFRDAAEREETDISRARISLPPAADAIRRGLYDAADLLTALLVT